MLPHMYTYLYLAGCFYFACPFIYFLAFWCHFDFLFRCTHLILARYCGCRLYSILYWKHTPCHQRAFHYLAPQRASPRSIGCHYLSLRWRFCTARFLPHYLMLYLIHVYLIGLSRFLLTLRLVCRCASFRADTASLSHFHGLRWLYLRCFAYMPYPCLPRWWRRPTCRSWCCRRA